MQSPRYKFYLSDLKSQINLDLRFKESENHQTIFYEYDSSFLYVRRRGASRSTSEAAGPVPSKSG